MGKNARFVGSVNSIFQQPWWLDAVAPGKWNITEVANGGQLVATMPYVLRRRWGMNLIVMPPFTQTLGPWLSPSNAGYARSLGRQKRLMNALIDQLPPFDYFSQSFNYSITNWQPFYWRGFKQTTRYTYVIDDLSDLDRVLEGCLNNVRTNIRKARRFVAVRDDLAIDDFIDTCEKSYLRQNMRLPYTREFVCRLDRACSLRGQRRMLFAEDAKGRVHSAIYFVWDNNSAYLLMSGGDPELRKSGAKCLLTWEAIKFCSTVTKRFDFEGSMIESVEQYNRSFGARQTAYFRILKMNGRAKFLRGANSLLCFVKNKKAYAED